jgi:hypothetical protein
VPLPRITHIRQDDTHRLIPSAYAEDSVLNRLTRDTAELAALFELEGATNDRLVGEAGLLPGIGVRELVFGLSYSHIVNAAFTHARPEGSRFNGPDRGAWYAGFSVVTSQVEVAFHKSEELKEIDWREPETFLYTDFMSDFRGEFHDIRRSPRFKSALSPVSYKASQRLAADLLSRGSLGIVYPSVRHRKGTCLACFRPALVNNVRKGIRVQIELEDAYAKPCIRRES